MGLINPVEAVMVLGVKKGGHLPCAWLGQHLQRCRGSVQLVGPESSRCKWPRWVMVPESLPLPRLH